MKFVDESLRNLQLDYLDCVMIHFPALAEDFDPAKVKNMVRLDELSLEQFSGFEFQNHMKSY